jgi:DnaJ-class molecular chaperone
MSASIPNHYVLLNIDPKADDAAIRRAYHRIALANHPDKTLGLPAAERERKATVFKQAAAAYECLLDHTKRRDCDYTLPRARPSYTAPPRSTPAPTPGREWVQTTGCLGVYAASKA